MSAAIITTLAPITLGSTTLPTANLRVSPAIATQMFRTSGLLFPSVEATFGAAPVIQFEATVLEAFNAIGFSGTNFTTCNVYLSTFATSIKATTGPKYALAASANAFAYITGVKADQNGVAMATVSVMLLSSNGTTHPLVASSGQTVATLSGQPLLKTLGPCTINGTTIAGTTSMNLDLGCNVDAMLSDGDLYPRVCAYVGGTPVFQVEHADPETLRATLGFTGVALASSFVQYLRDVDATTQITTTTGMSFTVALGRAVTQEFGADNQGVAKGGVRVECLSTSATHPIVTATGASVPTP